ncbi:MAG: hypothetical protein IJ688_11030 [Treponema sp.]|nr:hypothetical protein [Treponema sp.]
MKKQIKSLYTFLCISGILSLTFFAAGCSKEEIPVTENSINTIELSDGNEKELISTPQRWHITNKRLFVLFGYDFNTPQVYEPILSILKERYGLDSDGGLILPYIYPSDFRHGTRGYSSDLLAILQDSTYDFCGVLLIGAPENTHYAIARNQDEWQDTPYPVIALFPQDDILGLEATCDIVLDKGFTAGLKGDTVEDETTAQAFPEAPEIITETIDYILELNGPLEKNTSIQNHVLQMYHGKKIHHYTDPETGLQAINHFVLN